VHAVVVPDLRGHGNSKNFKGTTNQVDAATMRGPEFGKIVYDMEAVKKFLVKANNDSECNIEKLCVIGAGMGTVIAVNWAALDWSYPPLTIGKQGQDVLGLVLLSPARQFQSLNISRALLTQGVQQKISILIVVGAGKTTEKQDARSIFNQLERARPPLPKDLTPEQVQKRQELFLREADTAVQGADLLKAKGLKRTDNQELLNLPLTIADFIKLRLVDQNIDWRFRNSR